jgi:hypothetical protein
VQILKNRDTYFLKLLTRAYGVFEEILIAFLQKLMKNILWLIHFEKCSNTNILSRFISTHFQKLVIFSLLFFRRRARGWR